MEVEFSSSSSSHPHPSFQHSFSPSASEISIENKTDTYIMAAEAKAQTELQDFESLFSLDGKVAVVVCRLFNSLVYGSCLGETMLTPF